VRDRLFAFYDWCARHDDIPELLTLARTVARWENEIVAGVLTGVSNGRSEALNRIAKLEARSAYGFRNPASQRRRVKMACTRGIRRPPHGPSPRRSLQVTARQHDPG
jgi:transposase